MNGNLAEKVFRLAENFATHPGYLARYLSNNVLNRKSPLDLETPWFSYAAIDFLEKNVRSEMTVCEYGSGGSTLFFARRVQAVYSIEDNPKWFAMVTGRIKELEIRNAEVHLFPFDFKNPAGFEQSAYLNAIPQRAFDIYVIDGSEEWEQVRPLCFRHVEQFIRPGGMIIVDDAWRYPSLRTRNLARQVKTFQSAGPSRPGVTRDGHLFLLRACLECRPGGRGATKKRKIKKEF